MKIPNQQVTRKQTLSAYTSQSTPYIYPEFHVSIQILTADPKTNATTATAQPTAKEGDAIPAADSGTGAGDGAGAWAAVLATRAKMVTIAIATMEALHCDTAIAASVCVREGGGDILLRWWVAELREGARECLYIRGGKDSMGMFRAGEGANGQLPVVFTDWLVRRDSCCGSLTDSQSRGSLRRRV